MGFVSNHVGAIRTAEDEGEDTRPVPEDFIHTFFINN